jgi:copper homeostasis protein (lipoprotein)
MERTRFSLHAAALNAAALAAALLACACSRQPGAPEAPAQPAPPAAAQVPVAAVESGTAATMAQPGVQPADAGADARAVAGTYSGTLPCADCPGIDETLVLADDGSFVLTDTYRERPGSANVVQGSWSLEDRGKRIRLDPGSKDAADKLYGIDGDGLRLLDAAGKPIDSGLPYRLKRDA